MTEVLKVANVTRRDVSEPDSASQLNPGILRRKSIPALASTRFTPEKKSGLNHGLSFSRTIATRPVLPPERPLAVRSRRYPSSFAAFHTFSRVAEEMRESPFRARLTVALFTPAALATSSIVDFVTTSRNSLYTSKQEPPMNSLMMELFGMISVGTMGTNLIIERMRWASP